MTLSTDETACSFLGPWGCYCPANMFRPFPHSRQRKSFVYLAAVFVLVLQSCFYPSFWPCVRAWIFLSSCLFLCQLFIWWYHSLYQYIPTIVHVERRFRVTKGSSSRTCLTIRKSQYTQFLQERPWEDGRLLQYFELVYSHSMRNIHHKRYSSQQNRTYS